MTLHFALRRHFLGEEWAWQMWDWWEAAAGNVGLPGEGGWPPDPACSREAVRQEREESRESTCLGVRWAWSESAAHT